MTCYPLAQGRRLRVTAIDECGLPDQLNLCGSVVSSGFVDVSIATNIASGIQQPFFDARGRMCSNWRSPDTFTGHELRMRFCDVDPDLLTLTTNASLVTDWDDVPTGFRVRQGTATQQYALEVWMGVPDATCPDDAEASLGYVLFPWIQAGAIGNFQLGNDTVTFEVSGYTKPGSQWANGPYNVVPQDAMGTPGPLLEPIEPDVHAHLEYTTIAAPDPSCGCVEVESPLLLLENDPGWLLLTDGGRIKLRI